MNARSEMRKQQLLTDALVALIEAGKLTDADFDLMAEDSQLRERVDSKVYRRAGQKPLPDEIDYDLLFSIDTKPLAWQKSKAAATLGALGGAMKSDKKSKSSAANGAKGGRPRKIPANI